MKTWIKHGLSFIAVTVFVFLAIASVASKKNMTIEKGEIPPDIKGYKETIVIVSQTRQWNKYADKYFTENYQGKFIFVEEKELVKYPDTDKYRFFFGRNLRYMQEVGSSFSSVTSERLTMIDRKTGKTYATHSSSAFGKLLKYYSAALEEARTQK